MRPRLRASSLAHVFGEIRRDEGLPIEFSPEALEEASTAASSPPHDPPRADLRDIPFVTIDPVGSRDLDQAMAVTDLPGGGVRVRYAIADVATFVVSGGSLDVSAHRRGTTVYCPDRRVPLHPPVLSAGSASLLPGQDRPAIVWEIDVGGGGERLRWDVRRATVRSRQRHDYVELQSRFDHGDPPEPLAPLDRFGRIRIARGVERGALTLRLPEQEVVREDGSWQIVNRREAPVERWNAEVSLLTGMTAAEMMLEAGVGVLRTLPSPSPEAVGELRGAARALGIAWSSDRSASEILADLDPARPRQLALFEQATRLFRGAGYASFVDGAPDGDIAHAGVAAPYAHVTAPIRRLVDRAALETCLAVAGDGVVPEWVLTDLSALPGAMEETSRRAGTVERRCVDAVEAWLMSDRKGAVYEAVVLDGRRDGSELWLEEPAILAWVYGLHADTGATVSVRVGDTDVAGGKVHLEPVDA